MTTLREDVTFRSEGESCAAWLYWPVDRSQPVPAVALAHGMGATRHFHLAPFGEAFAAAGMAALIFDYRGFGSSTGQPRERIDPHMQIEDYRAALTFLSLTEGIDEQRLGVWGTSFSGGHVLHLGAYDPRVRAIVSQVGAMDIHANVQIVLSEEQRAAQRALIIAERKRRYQDETPAYIPLSAPDGEVALQPDTVTYEWLLKCQAEQAPGWNNQVTVDSIERILEHAPALAIERIAPKPLLMILAREDKWTPPALIREAFGRAGEPKQLLELDGDHYTVYSGEGQKDAAHVAAQWFKAHL